MAQIKGALNNGMCVKRKIILLILLTLLLSIALAGTNSWISRLEYSDELTLDEVGVLHPYSKSAICKEGWGDYIDISREIEATVKNQLPEPEQWLAIKEGSGSGGYGLFFFGVDAQKGYMLSYDRDYPKPLEKIYARSDALTLFDHLTDGGRRAITVMKTPVSSAHIGCTFFKLVYPDASIEVSLVGAQTSDAEQMMDKIHQFFWDIEAKQLHASEAQRYALRDLARKRDYRRGYTLQESIWHMKRGFKNTFFEIP